MSKKRNQYDKKFKALVALEAVKGQKTLSQLSSEYKIHANQIAKWKKKLLAELPSIFSTKKSQEEQLSEEREDQLLRQIGKLTVELDWFKKKSQLLS